MRKLLLIVSLPALLSACTFSLPGLTLPVQPATFTLEPARPATETALPGEIPTITPTLPTPTFTFTPTVLGGLSNVEATITPTATPTIVQLVLGSALTQTSFVKGFVSIILSEAQIHWGDCDDPHAVKVTAQVSEPARVHNVSVFVRLKNKTGGASGDWDFGTLMDNHFNGTFSRTIQAEELRNFSNYADAWIQLQFVSTDENSRVIDRTPIFANNLTLAACP